MTKVKTTRSKSAAKQKTAKKQEKPVFKPRIQKIMWTNEEVDTIINEVKRLRVEDMKTDLLKLVQAAINTLPEGRRRTLTGLSQIGKGFSAKLDSAMEELSLRAIERQIDDSEEVSEPPKIIYVETECRDPKKVLASLSTGTLLGVALDRMKEDFKMIPDVLNAFNNFQKETSKIPHQFKPVEPKPDIKLYDQGEHHKKPRVLIVGLKPQQKFHINERVQELGIPLDVRFEDSDKVVKDVPPSVNFVIVHRHSSHKWWVKMRESHVDKNKVMFNDGGIHQIIQKLYDIKSRVEAVNR